MSTNAEVWVVDRFEGDLAILVSDDGEVVETARKLLPRGSRVGVVLRVSRDADGELEWGEGSVDDEATRERRAEAEGILEELRKRDPGGDVAL
jgi:hypothetical protein